MGEFGYCRLCGILGQVTPLEKINKKILANIHINIKNHFDTKPLHRCTTCKSRFKKKHLREYNKRYGRRPTYYISIAPWDMKAERPAKYGPPSPFGELIQNDLRRSERQCKSLQMQDKQNKLEACIRNRQTQGLEISYFPDKGRGIKATDSFEKDDFVIEYIGELIDLKIAKGSYMYYFTYGEHTWCIDATEETTFFGRLINHSCSFPNLYTKVVEVDGSPHLVFLAKKDISVGDELLYDYGDRSKNSLQHHPWLAL